jgi:hypothetical protein
MPEAEAVVPAEAARLVERDLPEEVVGEVLALPDVEPERRVGALARLVGVAGRGLVDPAERAGHREAVVDVVGEADFGLGPVGAAVLLEALGIDPEAEPRGEVDIRRDPVDDLVLGDVLGQGREARLLAFVVELDGARQREPEFRQVEPAVEAVGHRAARIGHAVRGDREAAVGRDRPAEARPRVSAISASM